MKNVADHVTKLFFGQARRLKFGEGEDEVGPMPEEDGLGDDHDLPEDEQQEEAAEEEEVPAPPPKKKAKGGRKKPAKR